MDREQLCEFVSNVGLTPGVDRDAGVIRGVKMLGNQSRNRGRKHFSYPLQTRSKAVPLYEGVVCNVDHHESGAKVSYRDRIGVFKNVIAREDGTFGDLYFNPKHELAEQLCWDAEHAPDKLGFSHIADGKVNRTKPASPVVEEIFEVESVDLVANPATTRGMFESADELPEDQQELCEHGLSVAADARLILLGQESTETKKARLKEVLSVWQAELAGEPVTGKETSTMEWKEITREGLAENRKDLFEELTGTDAKSQLEAEIKTLQESVAAKDAELKEAIEAREAIEAENAAQAKKIAIAEELKESKLDSENKTVCSAAFMTQLDAAPDAAARKALIEDRVAITKGIREQAPAGSAPFARVGGTTAAKTKDEFMGRL